MPNWCENKVTVTGKPAQVKHFYHANHAFVGGTRLDGEEWGELREFSFHGILPTPKSYEKNGKWYDWNIKNWGTKWDCSGEDSFYQNEIKDGDTDFHGKLCLAFDTAWAPPVGIYEELVDKDFGVNAYYFEPGMDYAGHWYDGNDEFERFNRILYGAGIAIFVTLCSCII